MSKSTKADHAVRALRGAGLEVTGDAVRFKFADGSIMGMLIEEGDRILTGIEHFEKAMRLCEWLTKHDIMTEKEYRRIDDRIMRLSTKNESKNEHNTTRKAI